MIYNGAATLCLQSIHIRRQLCSIICIDYELSFYKIHVEKKRVLMLLRSFTYQEC